LAAPAAATRASKSDGSASNEAGGRMGARRDKRSGGG
jgi:hypothetical protein